MHLVRGQQRLGGDSRHREHASPILTHALRVVVGAEAAIERGVDAVADAAGACHESVSNAGKGVENAEGDHGKPASSCRSGCEMASALNKLPICRGSIKRAMP